jgi:hypothetical protein
MPSITYWNRLEPSPRDNDLDESLAARVRDPAWMLARQWQFGEFRGEDAASPAWMRFSADLLPLAAWSVGDMTRPLDGAAPLERVVESEPFSPDDLSTAVELGRTFEGLLTERDLPDLIPSYRTAYPIAEAPDDDGPTARLRALWRGRAVDGIGLYRAARSTLPALPPPAVDTGQEGGVRDALEKLVQWVDEVYGPFGGDDPPAWVPERLEYEARTLAAGRNGAISMVVRPGRHGELDWYSFDGDTGSAGEVPAAEIRMVERSVIPAAVRFRGMPNPRWWDFEDQRVDFGAVTADRRDLARLLLIDFLLVQGNDWFLVPFDQPLGTLCRFTSMIVRDVFGQDTPVARAETRGEPLARWTLFSTTTGDGFWGDWFVVPPSAGPSALRGPALEDVRFLRDETSNMAWAVEVATAGRLGEPLRGHERVVETPELPATASGPPLQYLVQTGVPPHWIPFVPVAIDAASREIALELAAILSSAAPEGEPPTLPEPLGKILRPSALGGGPYRLREEEVPREGTGITRAVRFTRWIDGSAHLWIARQRSVGTGEGWSGLRFDLAQPRRNRA